MGDASSVVRPPRGLIGEWATRTSDVVAVLVAAALMLTSAGVHAYRWDFGSRHVGPLDQLFLVQVAVTTLVALARSAASSSR